MEYVVDAVGDLIGNVREDDGVLVHGPDEEVRDAEDVLQPQKEVDNAEDVDEDREEPDVPTAL